MTFFTVAKEKEKEEQVRGRSRPRYRRREEGIKQKLQVSPYKKHSTFFFSGPLTHAAVVPLAVSSSGIGPLTQSVELVGMS
jgi:hypothetical protein